MNTETDYLRSIAEEIATNRTTHENKPNNHLKVETKRLEKAIIRSLNTIENFTQRDTFYFNTLRELVNICDILFDINGRVNSDVRVLIDSLTVVKGFIPHEVRPTLKLPKAFVEMQKEGLTENWIKYSTVMQEQGIGEKLIDIAGIPFKRFIEPKHILNWGDFTWLKGYQAKLDIMDWEDADCSGPAEALVSLLIGRDFNDDRFYIFCKKYIKDRTKAVAGKRQRLLEYAKCEKLVLQDTQADMPSFDAYANTVSTRLLKWIKEEIDFVETHERDIPAAVKFEFKWNIEMVAFFFKLLHERQAFGKITLERFATIIAANCSSIGKEEFQSSTISSRFYMKDLEVIKAIEILLLDMLGSIRLYLR